MSYILFHSDHHFYFSSTIISPARRRQLDYVEVEKEVVSRQIKEISLASNNLVSTGINYTVTVRLDGVTFKSECGT